MRKTIEKKILPEYYNEVRVHRKTFEIRKDEDDIEVGDYLLLKEWDGEKYTGHKTTREVTYVLRDVPEYGLKEGYCIIAIQPIGWDGLSVGIRDYHLRDKNGVPMIIGDKVRGTATWLGMPIQGVVDFKNGAYGIRWMRGEVAEFNPFCTFCNVEWEVLE